ncbi:hypothetical protein GCM10020331_040480 [Ectobacillus funiculus]
MQVEKSCTVIQRVKMFSQALTSVSLQPGETKKTWEVAWNYDEKKPFQQGETYSITGKTAPN